MQIISSGHIVNPADMRDFIGSNEYSLELLVFPEGKEEAQVKSAIDLLYQDLPNLKNDDSAAVATYLERLAGALETLARHKIAVIALTISKSHWSASGEEMPGWRHTHVFVVPAQAFFRASGLNFPSKKIHQFQAACQEAMAGLARDKTLTVWTTTEGVMDDYQNRETPWCPECCAKYMLDR